MLETQCNEGPRKAGVVWTKGDYRNLSTGSKPCSRVFVTGMKGITKQSMKCEYGV